MGKHERGVVQEVEEHIVSLLNGLPRPLPAGHPWAGHEVAVAQRLRADFAPTGAVHIGNRYDVPGDIDLATAAGHVLVEVKLSDSEGGVGTAANITQDAFTKYGIVPDTEAWSAWRKRRGYQVGMIHILDRWPAARRVRGIAEKGEIVKAAAERHADAQSVKDQAVAYANVDRSEYRTMLATRPVNARRLREVVLAIFMGAHTSAEIEQLLESGLPASPADVPDNYYVYYTNVRDGHITVRRHTPDVIRELLAIDDFQLELVPGHQSGRITARAGAVRVELLTFIHHWKNVFVGIKTPCINVFMGAYPRHLIR